MIDLSKKILSGEMLSRSDLEEEYEKINQKFLLESRIRFDKENNKGGDKLENINKDKFELRKDLLMLSGTVFGSSIALAAGRSINVFFFIGELLLFISIVVGVMILLVDLKGKDWDYAFFSKMSIESFLLGNNNKIDKFEVDSLEDLKISYQKIIDNNQRGLLYSLFKKIEYERWSDIYYIVFIIGILLILISLLPQLNR